MTPRPWALHSSPGARQRHRGCGESSAQHLRVDFVTHEEVTHRSNSVCRVWRKRSAFHLARFVMIFKYPEEGDLQGGAERIDYTSAG